jgi:CelD/BcsL family acetyltransferase involved in cellulose biosynthesis
VAAQSWQRPEPFPEFLPRLIEAGLASGEVEIWALFAGTEAVAAQIWVRRNRRATIFKLAFDRAWAAKSPGTVLTMTAMRQALDRGDLAEIDFGWGDDPYKRDWLPLRRQRFGLAAYNPRLPAGLAAAARNLLPKLLAKRATKGAVGSAAAEDEGARNDR